MLTLEFWRAVPDWYRYMGAAAAAVGGANADALIIAGGTDSESLLSYIATQPLLPAGAPGHECGPATSRLGCRVHVIGFKGSCHPCEHVLSIGATAFSWCSSQYLRVRRLQIMGLWFPQRRVVKCWC